MNRFSDFFGKYLDVSMLPDSLRESGISNVKINSQTRAMEIFAELSALVSKEELFKAEKLICGSIFELMQCRIYPRYPSDLFEEGYYPELVKELKRRYASLNGTLKDSSARIVDDDIIIMLQHGGKQLLKEQEYDKKLAALIKEEFGLTYKVRFEGITSIDPDSEVYIERQKMNEEKVLREKQLEEQELYESTMRAADEHKARHAKKPAPAPAVQEEIEIREGAGEKVVIRVEKEPVSVCLVHTKVPGASEPAVFGIEGAEPGVVSGVLVNEVGASVGGSVVNDDALPVLEALRLHGVDALPQVFPGVVYRYDNRDHCFLRFDLLIISVALSQRFSIWYLRGLAASVRIFRSKARILSVSRCVNIISEI